MNYSYNTTTSTIYGGLQAPVAVYSWAQSLQNNTWTELSGTAFRPWVLANVTQDSFNGGDPWNATMFGAFSDPSYDVDNAVLYYYGGGHGDTSMNGIFKQDLKTLAWSTEFAPTPTAKYPPAYRNGGSAQPGNLIYPSGYSPGMFVDADELTDPADAPYATKLARATTHIYASAAFDSANGEIIYPYAGAGGGASCHRYSVTNNGWRRDPANIGSQLNAINSNFNSNGPQQGTASIYDSVTGRTFMTLVPGDAGGSWRSGVIVFNSNTNTVEQVITFGSEALGFVLSSSSMTKVGRKLWIFTKIGGYSSPQPMNQGFIFDMDTKGAVCFRLSGDTALSTGSFNNGNQETIPCFYDGVKLRRWNYSVDASKILSVSVSAPISGIGSYADPFIYAQVATTIPGAPTNAQFVYSRMVWVPGANCAILNPRAASNSFALKLD